MTYTWDAPETWEAYFMSILNSDEEWADSSINNSTYDTSDGGDINMDDHHEVFSISSTFSPPVVSNPFRHTRNVLFGSQVYGTGWN